MRRAVPPPYVPKHINRLYELVSRFRHDVNDAVEGNRRFAYFTAAVAVLGLGAATAPFLKDPARTVSTSADAIPMTPAATAAEDFAANPRADTSAISAPRDGAVVAETALLRGIVSTRRANNYLVVRTPDGEDWIQGRSLKPDQSGHFVDGVRIGDHTTPPGTTFVVSILSTNATLPVGLTAALPGDAVMSSPIVLVRR